MGHEMTTRSRAGATLRWLSLGAGAAVGAYAAYAAVTWWRYGHPPPSTTDDRDRLLDEFMPTYDVVERHHINVRAPASITFAAACEADLMGSPLVRAIFKAREVLLGSQPDRTVRPVGLLALTKSLGWGVLAEAPDREIVMGAVTQPWEANVVFRALPPADFAAFHEPGYVKIAWTLRADPAGASASVFHTETRAVATDASARTRFRQYWSLLSPGIILIRWMTLEPVRRDAEQRARTAERATVQPARPVTARED